MKVTKIRFGITVNLGNYESVRFEREVELEPYENPAVSQKSLEVKVMEVCKDFCKEHDIQPTRSSLVK